MSDCGASRPIESQLSIGESGRNAYDDGHQLSVYGDGRMNDDEREEIAFRMARSSGWPYREMALS